MAKEIYYQNRWYDSNPNTVTYGTWYPWYDIDEDGYKKTLEFIEQGYKYQVRILVVEEIKGWGLDE
jgi:hypothetical protein